MIWLYFSLAAATFESLRDVFSKVVTNKSDRPLDEYLVAWGLRAFTLIIYIPWLLLSPQPIPNIGKDFWWALLADATLSTVGGILYMRALRLGDLSLTVPLMGFSPLFLVIASPFTLGELPNNIQIIGISLVCLGAYFLNLKPKENNYFAPLLSHIPHPKILQREITEMKIEGSIKTNRQSEKRHLRNSKSPKMSSKSI
ncbi:EamA family transporter, partial [Aphanizomenon sp. CS-733/32]|uniref:EamA family transporter n=1 Tax=Aphanizomenon sp. CS-733/32 TaxID=3021715 RepID=UPI003FA436CE